ncbi:MAG: ROK family protein [Oscillospiraceae bacterium]|jgi:glucokinase|nr:ROK family protein [Oscillospiraceae bacterium]
MYSLGIDIGGTKCAVVLGRGALAENKEGFILDKIAFPTEVSRGVDMVIAEITGSIDKLFEKNKVAADMIVGIGISCGGPLDSRTGVIKSPPNLPGWDEVPIVEILSAHYGVKTKLQNDANACAVAEWMFGAARGSQNAMFLTFGTGMGAGLILDGRLYSGTNDMAGEVGHIRLANDGPEGYGKRGSFEGFCSGGGIARMGQEMAEAAKQNGQKSPLFADLSAMTAKSLALAATEGDAFALSVYERCAKKLGLALSIFIDVLNPEKIVIGSIYERNQEMFNRWILPIIEEETLSLSRSVCEIVPAQLGDSIGDYAALALALL